MRAVVVGTGFGARVHVPALRAAGFEVVALVGRDEERTRRRADRLGIAVAATSLADALEQAPAVAVTVATPPDAHATVVLDAIAAGCHVLCEKPFALDAVEAERMLGAAEAAGVVHLVGHEFRFATDRAVAGRALRDGRVGEPRLALLVQTVALVADPGTALPGWWFDPARGGGWLGASGSHVVDQVHHWLGPVARVTAVLPAISGRGAEDSFVAVLTMRSGCVVTVTQSAAAWGEPRATTAVIGTAGTVWLDAGAAWLGDAVGIRELAVPAALTIPDAPDRGAGGDDARHRFTHIELGPYTRLCERFAAAIDGSSSGDAATFVDGVAVQRVLDAMRASHAAGGVQVSV